MLCLAWQHLTVALFIFGIGSSLPDAHPYPDVGDRIVYVRTSGCDIGYCQSPNTPCDFSFTTTAPTAAPKRRRALSISGSSRQILQKPTPPSIPPTALPTASPTKSPSAQPTKSPTLQSLSLSECSNHIQVSVTDSNGNGSSVIPANFDQAYHAQSEAMVFGKQVWKTDDGRTMFFAVGHWFVVGLNNEMLTHPEPNVSALYPPASSSNWTHSSMAGMFHVDLVCLGTLSPTSSPTPNPTKHPLAAPNDVAEFAVCNLQSISVSQFQPSMLMPLSVTKLSDVVVHVEEFAQEIWDGDAILMIPPNPVPPFSFDLLFANGSAVGQVPEFMAGPNRTTYDCYATQWMECTQSDGAMWRSVHAADYLVNATLVDSSLLTTSPYDAYFVARCGEHTRRPTASPTMAPTIVTTEGPATQDYTNSTCGSLEYAYNCLIGLGGFPDHVNCVYDGDNGGPVSGDGVVDLGSGDWQSLNHGLDFRQLIFRGQGWDRTTLHLDGNPQLGVLLLELSGSTTYIMYENLELTSNLATLHVTASNGATLHFKNVTFATHASWTFYLDGLNASLIFEDCVFYLNEILFAVESGLQAQQDCSLYITRSHFRSVTVTGSVSELAFPTLFDTGSTTVTISHSSFVESEILIGLFAGTTDIWNTSFYGIGTGGTAAGTALIECSDFQVPGSGSLTRNGSLTMRGCTFQNNAHVTSLIKAVEVPVNISGCTFMYNTALYDIRLAQDRSTTRVAALFLSDSRFVNERQSIHVGDLTYAAVPRVIRAVRTQWIHYQSIISAEISSSPEAVAEAIAEFTECEFHNGTGNMTNILARPLTRVDSLSFTRCLFMGNVFQESVFSMFMGTLRLINTTFQDNRASTGISLHALFDPSIANDIWNRTSIPKSLIADVTIDGCVFQSNSIKDGHLVSVLDAPLDSTIEILETTFDSCNNSYCLQVNGADLTIDKESLQHSNTLLFGHQMRPPDMDYSYNISIAINSSLYLLNFDASSDGDHLDYVENAIGFTAYRQEDTSVSFEPCTAYAPNANTSFDLIGGFNWETAFIVDEAGGMSEQTWICPDDVSINNCHINCDAKLSCVLTDFLVADTEVTTIECNGIRSCWDSTLQINSSSSVSIACTAENACKDSTITLRSAAIATIECLVPSSCDSAVIQIISSNVTIRCYQEHACDNLQIMSDTDLVEVYMFNHNDNVQVSVPNEFRPATLHCDEGAYLNLDGDTVGNLSVAREMASLYQALKLPCADITYSFTVSGRASCITQYQFGEIPGFPYFPDFVHCLPFYTSSLYSIECIGTWSPTTDPTNLPTVEPTKYPTRTPTVDPTSNPTLSPTTREPTQNPTMVPTYNPSVSPTTDPTKDPTSDPTWSPSSDPTVLPTREPTESNIYDSYFQVQYAITNWTLAAIEKFAGDVSLTVSALTEMVERGYTENAELILHFEEFWVQIERINGVSVDKKWQVERAEIEFLRSKSRILLEGRVLCSVLKCDHIVKDYDREQFEAAVTEQLREYFGADTLVDAAAADGDDDAMSFEVVSQSEEAMSLLSEEPETTTNFGFLGALSVAGILVLVALISIPYNKGICGPWKPCQGMGCHRVDDGKYIALMSFALHIYDFASDINLSMEICFHLLLLRQQQLSGDDESGSGDRDWMLLVCAIGSVVFLVVPYAVNLYFATKVKQMVESNEGAKQWFYNHSKVFAALVALSGGCYSSLHLVSSNLFGLSMLSSGLTRYELRNQKVANIRFFGNVLCENMPQLVVQALYAVYLGTVNEPLLFAFVASLLSVVNHSLSYCIEKRLREEEKNIVIAYYYLIVRCEQRTSSLSNAGNARATTNPLEDEFDDVHVQSVSSGSSNNLAVSPRVKLTELERKSIANNMGKRNKLTKAMIELFGTNKRYIQIASTTLTTQGFICLVVHFVNMLELSSPTPGQHIRDMYKSAHSEVDELFQFHFNLSHDFTVQYQLHLTMMSRMNSKAVDDDQPEYVDDHEPIEETSIEAEMAVRKTQGTGATV